MKFYTKASRDYTESSREKKHRKIAFSAAAEGIVLLDNHESTLPIKPGPIALYGTGGHYTIKGGTGSGEVNERYSSTIYDGLMTAGFTITSRAWLEEHKQLYAQQLEEYKRELSKKTRTLSIRNIMNAMGEQFLPPFGREITEADYINSQTDTAIYVISRQAGEGLDRRIDNGENAPAEAEIAHLNQLTKLYRKTILVINTGSSLDLSSLDSIKGIGAIVYFCQQGMEGGNALAAVLTGQVSPSGRLTATWPMKYEDIPYAMEYSYLNGDLSDEFYREGIYVGYRYFDSFKIKPRYCFGHGLSYTQTEMKLVHAEVNGSRISLEVDVANQGNFSSKEVVQVYVSCPSDKLLREAQHLAAFGKTSEIAPGNHELVSINFDLTELAAFDEDEAAFILEAGDYVINIGHSSRNSSIAAVIRLDARAIVSTHEHIMPLQKSFNELMPVAETSANQKTIPDNALIIVAKANDIRTISHKYEKPAIYQNDKVDAIINKLTINEMIDVVVGTGMFIGKNRIDIPGSVGNTTSKLYKKGLINVALCDGPAGLRLAREAGMYKAGFTKPYSMPLSFFENFPRIVKRFMTANRKKTKPVYQYATAFPVGTALAQTWNMNLLEQIGEAIGTEMKEYGITYWLAPALNIQRNPLCGRNFEYFSEDPLISGKSAAAIVRGVQTQDGLYTTIKHFLCNNQEDNRNYVSCNVHERTLREIYLKGFKIAVEEANAAAVMTSYNRINGIYAPESYDACTKVLRNEWGFKGVVMTDWMSTGKDKASSAKSISAGNDLIMAGTSFDKKDIRKAIKAGTLDIDDLRRCCANVIHSIANSSIAQEISAEMFEL